MTSVIAAVPVTKWAASNKTATPVFDRRNGGLFSYITYYITYILGDKKALFYCWGAVF
jgi:hypothetical protein